VHVQLGVLDCEIGAAAAHNCEYTDPD
jgi:hypothetical protein